MTKSGKHCGKKEKLHVLCNFFFCHYVFKKPSAAEASESVYMRERVNTSVILPVRVELRTQFFFYQSLHYFLCYHCRLIAGIIPRY